MHLGSTTRFRGSSGRVRDGICSEADECWLTSDMENVLELGVNQRDRRTQ